MPTARYTNAPPLLLDRINFMIGKTLAGRYHIISHLGGGGFGQTFVAQDTRRSGNPKCVVKQLKPQAKDPTTLQIARRLFDSETEVLHQLGIHPEIPELLDHFEENQEFYLVQEYIIGEVLGKKLIAGKRFTEPSVVIVLCSILKVLEFVHQKNVIHRDIKPDNLIKRSSDGKIVLIDFGAVRQIRTQLVNSQGLTISTVAVGTPGYMPSEQAVGNPRLSSDIYAVGMIAIQALTGLVPYQLPQDPDTDEIIWRNHVQVSTELADIIDKMVRYDFRQRYYSAKEALQAVEKLEIIPHPPTSSTPSPISSIPTQKIILSNNQTLASSKLVAENSKPNLNPQPPSPLSWTLLAPLEWKFLFNWVRATTIGTLVGFVVSILIGYMRGHPSDVFIFWGVIGAALGIMQWSVLDQFSQLYRTIWWTVATPVGLVLGAILSLAMGVTQDLAWFSGIVSASIGTMQLLILQGQIKKAELWIVATTVSGLFSNAVSESLMGRFEGDIRNDAFRYVLIVSTFAVTTGITLVLMLKNRVSQLKNKN